MDENLSPSCIIRTAMPEHKKLRTNEKTFSWTKKREQRRKGNRRRGGLEWRTNFFIKLFETYIALVLYIFWCIMWSEKFLLLCRIDNGSEKAKKRKERKKARQFYNEKRFKSLSAIWNKLDGEKWNKKLHMRSVKARSRVVQSANIIDSNIALRKINQKTVQ